MRAVVFACVCASLWYGGCDAAAPTSLNGPGGPPPPPGKSLQPTLEAVSVQDLRSRQRRAGPAVAAKAAAKGIAPGTPGLPLEGELSGAWDTVDAYLTFPYRFPDSGFEAQVLLRGFDVGPPVDGTRYRVDAWDRTIYWLDFDVADPAKVPRLLATLQLADGYQPQPNDAFPEFRTDAAVIDACAAADCTINWVPYVLLREAGRDYASYPDAAADASMYFVADAQGDALVAVMDISDASGNFERTDFLYEGDELEVSTIAYRISEPGFVYIVKVMNAEVLGNGFAIERRHYIPGEDFEDPDLVDDLDAANRPIRLLIDAQRGNPAEFQFAGPFDLGYTWGKVPHFVFGSDFESRAVATAAKLVRRRQ